MADPNELQVVRQAVLGDRGALGQLLRNHQHRLYNVVLRMVHNRDDASELTQEAMLRVVQHIGTYDGQAAFSTWIIRIAMNLSISFLRKRKLRLAVSLDTASGAAQSDNQAAPLNQLLRDHREPRPHDRVQKDEAVAQLNAALHRVAPELRAILVLRDLQDMDYAQIAQVLTVPVGTVKSRLFRARLALRREMYQLCADHEITPAPQPPRGSARPEAQPGHDGGPAVRADGRRPEFPTG